MSEVKVNRTLEVIVSKGAVYITREGVVHMMRESDAVELRDRLDEALRDTKPEAGPAERETGGLPCGWCGGAKTDAQIVCAKCYDSLEREDYDMWCSIADASRDVGDSHSKAAYYAVKSLRAKHDKEKQEALEREFPAPQETECSWCGGAKEKWIDLMMCDKCRGAMSFATHGRVLDYWLEATGGKGKPRSQAAYTRYRIQVNQLKADHEAALAKAKAKPAKKRGGEGTTKHVTKTEG
jgi:hypothetical protein